MWNFTQGTLRCPNDHVYTQDGEPVEATQIEPDAEEFASATLIDRGSHIVIKLVRKD